MTLPWQRLRGPSRIKLKIEAIHFPTKLRTHLPVPLNKPNTVTPLAQLEVQLEPLAATTLRILNGLKTRTTQIIITSSTVYHRMIVIMAETMARVGLVGSAELTQVHISRSFNSKQLIQIASFTTSSRISSLNHHTLSTTSSPQTAPSTMAPVTAISVAAQLLTSTMQSTTNRTKIDRSMMEKLFDRSRLAELIRFLEHLDTNNSTDCFKLGLQSVDSQVSSITIHCLLEIWWLPSSLTLNSVVLSSHPSTTRKRNHTNPKPTSSNNNFLQLSSKATIPNYTFLPFTSSIKTRPSTQQEIAVFYCQIRILAQ